MSDADAQPTDESAEAPARLPKILKAPQGTGRSISALFDEATTSPKVIKRRVIARIEDIQAELQTATDEAAEIIEAARVEAERIREQAREEGHREGVSQVMEALEQARSEYDRTMQAAEQDMLELAMRMAERIVRHQIELAPELAKDLIDESLDLVRDKRQIMVIVHPEDLPILEQWRSQLEMGVEASYIHFEEDERIGRGGCMIETEAGRVDARLEVQLQTFKQALMG